MSHFPKITDVSCVLADGSWLSCLKVIIVMFDIYGLRWTNTEFQHHGQSHSRQLKHHLCPLVHWKQLE